MSRRFVRLTSFEARSLLLIASVTLGVAGSAYAQSTAAPAKPAATDTEITAAFTKADKNADGKLSKDEATTLPALAAKFDSADADKDGTISAAEFGKAMKM
jgi:hypothetical protein